MIAQQEIASAEAVLTQETVQPMTKTDVIAEGPRFLSGAQALMESLIAEGTEVIFGYPGGAIMPTYDALFDYMDHLDHILVRHEQGAGHAAQGYARTSGKPGVCRPAHPNQRGGYRGHECAARHAQLQSGQFE